MRKRNWLEVLMLVAALASPAVRADPPCYRVEVIGNPRTNTQPFGLNNMGQAAGTRYFGDEETGGFLYDHGRITQLEGLGFVPQVRDINDRGEIVGGMTSALSAKVGFLYRDGNVIDITASLSPNVRLASAVAINERGHAVGSADGKAFFYDGSRSFFINHAAFGAASVEVMDVNDHDAMVGLTYDTEPGEQFSFVWRDGELTKIPALGEGAAVDVFAINNAGQAVGLGEVPGRSSRPFLYSDGVSRDLGTLGGNPSDSYGGVAYDINDQGWIVGDSFTSTLQLAGYLYMEGRMHNLNDLLASSAAAAWTVTQATRINDAGQIVAFARRNGGDGIYSLLLSPVPEPQALALWLVGLTLVGTTAGRRLSSSPVAAAAG